MAASQLWEMLHAFLADAGDLVWPGSCVVCNSPSVPTRPSSVVCASCFAALTHDPDEACPRCASTVGAHSALDDGCPRCRGERFRFSATIRLGRYDGCLRDAVLITKDACGEPLAEELGRLWASGRFCRLPDPKPTLVVPVPLHWWRRWERGYNQSAAIARGIADCLDLRCQPRALVRVRPTPQQRTRSASERRENVRGAFRMGRFARVQNERVLLVDDVLTTGATADAAAATLTAGGAAQVTVAVIAHR